MRLLNVALVAATVIVMLGGYLQEKKRLGTIRELPAARARALFEATERQRERVRLVVSVVLALGAAVALAAKLRR